jgi:DoxX-like family
MNIGFLVVQSLLGLFFLLRGLRYTFLPIATLAKNKDSKFLLEIPEPLTRFIGVAKTLAGLALIVSIFTGLVRWSTPFAALELALLVLCAGTFHIRRREYNMLPLNVTLLALALFVALGH